jgi:hypothetical protein
MDVIVMVYDYYYCTLLLEVICVNSALLNDKYTLCREA